MNPLFLVLAVGAGLAGPEPGGAVPAIPEPPLGPHPDQALAWAGIPLARLPDLGLGEPVLDLWESTWQAPLPGGGFVRVGIHADPDAARAAFDFQRVAATTRELPPLAVPGLRADDLEAAGDGSGVLLVRTRNVVLLLRDHQGEALARLPGLLGALVVEAPEGWVEERRLGDHVVQWDACGRRWER